MDRVAMEVERDPLYEAIIHAQRIGPEATGADAISAAARTVAETLNLAAIICYTASGATSLRAARERPGPADLGAQPIPATGRKLALVWGLHCVLTDDPRDLDDMVAKACRIAYQEGFALPASASSSPPACRSARLAPPICCALPLSATTRKTYSPRRGGAAAGRPEALDVLAADLARQKLDRLAGPIEKWVHLQRLAVGLERFLLGAERLEHEAEVIQRPVMLGIALERTLEIGKRGLIFLLQVMHLRAQIPSFGFLGRDVDCGIEDLEREIEIETLS